MPKPQNELSGAIEDMKNSHKSEFSDGVYDEVKALQGIFSTKIHSMGDALNRKNEEINISESTQMLNTILTSKLDDYIFTQGPSNLNSNIAKNMLTYLTSTLNDCEKPKKELDYQMWMKVQSSFVSNISCFILIVNTRINMFEA